MLLEATDDTVLFIDEAHLLSDHAQTTLFRAVEERKLFLPKGPTARSHTVIPLSRFTLALATTDAHGILGPLLDRMKLVLHFEFYSAEELAELCRQRAQAMQWNVEPEVFPLIAGRSKSTPRLALRLLESCYRTSRAEGSDVITGEHFHRTVLLEGLDRELGLDKSEQAYLRLLASGEGKPLRLNLLASRLGLPAQTLSGVIEPYLLREGLIDRIEAGRTLTDKGDEYVHRNYSH